MTPSSVRRRVHEDGGDDRSARERSQRLRAKLRCVEPSQRLSAREACQLTGLSYQRMLAFLESGEIAGEHKKGDWTVTRKVLDRWIDEHRVVNDNLEWVGLVRPERSGDEALQQLLTMPGWGVEPLACKLQVSAKEIEGWTEIGVPDRFAPVLDELLAGPDELADTRRLATQLVGTPEREAWSIVKATGREWQDITGATAVTADLRSRRVRVYIEGGVVRSASGG